MRLLQFIGKDVRGYMNFDIKFRESVTFLIGINGSGKTTVLKLLSGLLTPSYIDLSQIEYSEIVLSCQRTTDNSTITISSKKKTDEIILKYIDEKNNETVESIIPCLEQSILRKRYDAEIINTERFKRYLFDFYETSVAQKIKEMKTPLFLGLNRRIIDTNRYDISDRELYFARRRHNLDFMFDNVDEALNDIQEMFYNSIRQNARRQSALSDSFRKRVFSESFRIADDNTIPIIEYNDELNKLQNRRTELNNAIEKLGMKDLSTQFSIFFDSIQKTLEILSKTSALDSNKTTNPDYVNALLKWMTNSIQIEKIDKIIQYANEYSLNISKLKEPIIRFMDSANLFFKESNKIINVNEQGDINIIIKGAKKANNLFELSSGEKQLLIMLAHLSFHKQNQRSSIFIIDEPELSLHISWQELFVDAVLKASPETQFIMATHAPAILAKPERKEWCEDLSK